jgi:polysaccharide biosynthesis/export protein
MNIKSIVLFCLAGFLLAFGSASVFAQVSESYKLNQGDVLQVSVWGEETLNKEVRVLPDGSVTFPLAGRVEVLNVTVQEAEKRITEKLKIYMPDPQVSVVVAKPEGNVAYVIGKVLKPGPVPLVGEATVLQAISMAGGLDKFADGGRIKVLRGDGKNQTTMSVDYNSLIKGQSLQSNITLNAGDTILVP